MKPVLPKTFGESFSFVSVIYRWHIGNSVLEEEEDLRAGELVSPRHSVDGFPSVN